MAEFDQASANTLLFDQNAASVLTFDLLRLVLRVEVEHHHEHADGQDENGPELVGDEPQQMEEAFD